MTSNQKSVPTSAIKQRVAEMEDVKNNTTIGLSMREEMYLSCMKELVSLREQAASPSFLETVKEARSIWLEENDPRDGTDCVTPFDHFFYGATKAEERERCEDTICHFTHDSPAGELRCQLIKGHTGPHRHEVSDRCEHVAGEHSRCRHVKGHAGPHTYRVYRHG